MYKVISSSSNGNCLIYGGVVALDLGVTFKQIEPYLYDLQIILLTHLHSDHLNIVTIKRICDERPGIRIGCCEWMLPYVEGYRNVDLFVLGNWYNYGPFKIMPIKAIHDIPNCGYLIHFGDYKIFHITDTSSVNHLSAKNYDIIAIEHNYDEDLAEGSVKAMQENNEYSHKARSIATHLSIQQAQDFIFQNRGTKTEVIRLHQSENE